MSDQRIAKKFHWLMSLLLIALAIVWAFSSQLPSANDYQTGDEKQFSQINALKHLKKISSEPHFVGAPAHANVREYLTLELEKLGLEVETFEHLSTDPHRWSASNTKNIITKISGRTKGKALALVSHYDSGTYSSLGASDAGSGVVTILEGIRAFIANGTQPKNDIIVIFTDAEEQGLLGAGAFVNFHPWTKDISLVLNFEARGSGGSSYMLIETNGGNKNLIQAFDHANVNIPVANSLMYAVYKSLPNDTDLTVFREQADIDGFNFAFIDDHFDYHTAQDTYQRIDKESLNHQANYLMALLNHFAFADISQLKSDEDMVYFNFPGLDMVIYPNSWVTPLVLLAALLFVVVTFNGLKQTLLSVKGICIGFVPLILCLIISGATGYFGWQLMLLVFPQYADIAQGFTYNGHWILVFFVSIACVVTLLSYRLFNKSVASQDLFVAPVTLWLIINIMIALKLPGAGFFIIPLLLALVSFALHNNKRLSSSKKLLFTSILVLPAVMILTPLIPLFVIGLGLNMVVIASILTCLTLILLVPVFCNYPVGNKLIFSISLLSLLFFIVSVFLSDYTEDRKKPNSVNYIYDTETDTAFMVSYNRSLDEFTRQFFDNDDVAKQWDPTIYPQNHRSKVRFSKVTNPLALKAANVEVLKDEVLDDLRTISLVISPQRATNIIQLASENDLNINKMLVNGQTFRNEDGVISKKIRPGFFFKYIVSNSTEKIAIELTVPEHSKLALKVFGTSFDLLDRVDAIQLRSEIYMPEPFAISDATIIGQSITLD